MFNTQQQKAIDTLEGRVRVIAGAGSGKTSVLTHRYANLIKHGINSKNILCVTFTNKAADEMKERVKKLVGEIDTKLICTFHSFCLTILRESIDKFKFPKKFGILDAEDQKSLIRKVYKENKIEYENISYLEAFSFITHKKLKQEHTLDFVTLSKNIEKLYRVSQRQLSQVWIYDSNYKEVVANCIYYGYLYSQQKISSLDFNDLLVLTVLLFKQKPSVLKKWQDRLKYIMVDEFQDTSLIQDELIDMLSSKHNNLFVVGDPDQTIYSWRYAKPEILLNFKGETIILDQNYRSTPEILDIANELISINKQRIPKNLFTKNEHGEKIIYKNFNNPKEEANWIVSCINQLKSMGKSYKDITILYRMHYLSRFVEEQLIQNRIPYIIHSGINFYERKEIKDILAYLKVINNFDDDLSLERIINVPARGIGNKTVNSLKIYADINNCSLFKAVKDSDSEKLENFLFMIASLKAQESKVSLSDFVYTVIDKTGYLDYVKQDIDKNRIENVFELIHSIEIFEKDNSNLSLSEYLQNITLLTNSDKKSNKDCVNLMTIHASKGLEFPIVFVCGMEEGVFPSGKVESEEELEEERRLAYVAYTRAKNMLFLSNSIDMGYETKCPSRFLTEVKQDHYKQYKNTV